MQSIQSDPLNSYSLSSSFSLNMSGKFENFETITIDTKVKSAFYFVIPVSSSKKSPRILAMNQMV